MSVSKLKTVLWKVEASARSVYNRYVAGAERFSSLGFDPQDIECVSARADQIFGSVDSVLYVGSVTRSRKILEIIEEYYPTPLLVEAYFANLSAVFERKIPLSTPGRLVIGLGTGRCGSTSLAARLGAVANSCSTHENPPLVYWMPAPEQVSFHLRRFAMLLRYYELVADCAHWWINLVDVLVDEFPQIKFVGLERDKYACAISFARIKGVGRSTFNHWARHPNSVWSSTAWDPTYPTFDTPDSATRDPDRAKWEMIDKYLDLYHLMKVDAAARLPDKFLLLQTEQLNDTQCIARLYSFIGKAPALGPKLVALNVRTTKDGRLETYRV